MTRLETAQKLAHKKKWGYYPATMIQNECFVIYYRGVVLIPAPDATFVDHLAFLGELAEACFTLRLMQQDFVEAILRKCKADTDLSQAAMIFLIGGDNG